VQLRELVGARGLLPLGEFLDRYRASGAPLLARLYHVPTVFWAARADVLLTALPLLGAALAIALTLGVGGRAVPIALWALYLSCITAGRDFFYYQWDNLLLEASFLAIFLPARGSLFGLARGRRPPEPSRIVVFLLQWLLFRLLFESAMAKILYGQEDWLTLRGMTYYYETAPLPSWGGWFVQQFPLWFHQGSVLFTFLVELVLPCCIFLPRPFRRVFFVLHLPFQMSIGLTSNYGFFNLLSIALSILVLDDADLERVGRFTGRLARRIAPRLLGRGGEGPAPPGGERAGGPVAGPGGVAPSLAVRLGAWVLAGCIVPASLFEASSYLVRGAGIDEALAPWRALYAPFRSINVYHLFPGIVRERIVAEIEETADGVSFSPCRLRYAPGDPKTPPPMTWLHNPRFPFHYSFLTLGRGRRDEEYMNNLAQRLCCDPQAAAPFFEPQPALAERPAALRLSYYRYRFGTWDDLSRTGVYWLREPVGQPSRPVACRCAGNP